MEILYLLIPLSAVLVLAIIGVFGWALWRGQFDDLEHEGQRILEPDQDRDADRGAGATLAAAPQQATCAVDADQFGAPSAGQESPPKGNRPLGRTGGAIGPAGPVREPSDADRSVRGES